MSSNLSTVAYIGATILFILSLGGLSNQETARRGNLYGMIGMTLAVLATVLGPQVTSAGMPWIVGSLVVGGAIGLYAARSVQMTQMPELVALMHSMVGMAAVLVGYATYVDPEATKGFEGAAHAIHSMEIYIGIFIGAVTFSGSVAAFGKLSGRIGGSPLLLPARHWINLAGLLAVFYFGRMFLQAESIEQGMFPVRDERDCAFVWHPHGHGHWWRRHAGGGFNAEQLFRMGSCRHGLYVEQRFVDCGGCFGGFKRRNSVLHHVQRHEPQFHQCDCWRLWYDSCSAQACWRCNCRASR